MRAFSRLLNGQSGVGPITQFDATEQFSTRIAAEVKNFDPAAFMEKKKIKEISRFIPFAIAATRMALEQADLNLTDEERDRAGVFIGVGLGGLENLERCTITLTTKGPGKVSPYFIPSLIANLAAGQVSMAFGLRGPSMAHTSACSSSAHAIGEALRMMQRGDSEVMVVGGAEATITPIGIAGFGAMFALSRRNDEPERASRPWDKGRDGFVCGEGAGTLIFETLTRAKKRGARILAEVSGYGATSDAYHITKPAPDHAQAARAMRQALQGRQAQPRADRLHQRARHLDARRRHGRGQGRRQRLRRPRAGQEAVGQLDQEHDGPPARRRRRGRSRRLHQGHRNRRDPADHQPRRSGHRSPARLRAEQGSRAPHQARDEQLVRFRRHQRDVGVLRLRGLRALAPPELLVHAVPLLS